MLSRKYYIMIARVIKKNTIINDDDMLPHNKVNKISLIADFMRELHKDNSLFDGKRFIDACAVDDD
tara:strand:+ start:224 stop:421 length:198 start_codon:yes stop_codon:yes gene_type:complete